MVFRMAGLLLVSGFAFLFGFTVIRRLRKNLTEESTWDGGSSSVESLPLHTYHAVIQQLKQQKHELQSLQLVERKRAKSTENISAAVLSNLSSGVMFFAPNGLIRQATFATPSTQQRTVAEAVQASLRESSASGRMELEYVTPLGEKRFLEITVTAVNSSSDDILGAACLINDKTEVTLIHRQQELRGEMSAEMALALRTSLTTISGY